MGSSMDRRAHEHNTHYESPFLDSGRRSHLNKTESEKYLKGLLWQCPFQGFTTEFDLTTLYSEPWGSCPDCVYEGCPVWGKGYSFVDLFMTLIKKVCEELLYAFLVCL